MPGDAPLLITGGSGQIGGALVRLCAQAGIAAIAPVRDALDLGDREQLTDCILTQKWSGVVNCAAYTAVDQAEVEKELAGKINAQAPAIIAEACAKADIPLVHLSTDYVFNGTKNAPYLESDAVDPIGVYGSTKAAGERAVQAAGGSHAIIRTAWVLSAGPRNFLTTMLRLAAERDELRVVDDQLGCPTSAEDVAGAVLRIVGRMDGHRGIWHCVNSGQASWFELARHIFEVNQAYGQNCPRLVPISSAEFPTAAHRPANSRLSTGMLSLDFDIEMRPWQDAVTDILGQIHNARSTP